MLSLTERAVDKIRTIIEEENQSGKGLRVFVEGGGCSGFMYGFEFDDTREGDNVLTQGLFDVYVDPFSASHLKGSVIDFTDGLSGKGFQVVNPNATGTCGCGQSFSS
jgi:iron-sulfur cluster assembly accessory protein